MTLEICQSTIMTSVTRPVVMRNVAEIAIPKEKKTGWDGHMRKGSFRYDLASICVATHVWRIKSGTVDNVTQTMFLSSNPHFIAKQPSPYAFPIWTLLAWKPPTTAMVRIMRM